MNKQSIPTWVKLSHINSNYHIKIILLLLVFCQFIASVQLECNTKPISQQFYISSTSWCKFKYDSCNKNQMMTCQKFQCPFKSLVHDDQQCNSIMQSNNVNTCIQYCCQNQSSDKNVDQKYTLQICSRNQENKIPIKPNNNQSSQSTSGWTIIFIFLGTGFILGFFIFCNKKEQEKQNNKQKSAEGLPPTAVNLNGYDLNSQGPYFVNANDCCAICLDKNVNLRTYCNHFYHGKCLVEWLKNKINNPCPLCQSTQYNPVKLYCKQCHIGDKLITVEARTSQQIIAAYEAYKCTNCKKIGDNSFSLNEEQSQKGNQLDRFMKNKDVLNQQMDESSDVNDQQLYGQSSNPRRKRKLNKLKKAQNKAKLQENKNNDNQEQEQDQSEKQIYKTNQINEPNI